MEKIASFMIDHLKMFPWVYVSRKDEVWNSIVTTFDIRMTKPNSEPVMNTAEMHAIEHIWATFLRNHKDFWSKIIYFGPMWCRTWFYLLLNLDYTSKEILPLIIELYTFISKFEWDIPGQSAMDCWNHLDMNLPMAKYISNKYLKEILLDIKEQNLIYPK